MTPGKLPVIVVCTVAFVLYACNNDVNQQTDADAQEDLIIVIADTDIAQLQKSTSIPGKPKAVWWARSTMGSKGSNGVPGPTDNLLMAVIDYGSSDVVAELVGEAGGRAVRLVSADWFPDELVNTSTDNEGRIPAQQYRKVPGYHPDALIRVPESLPTFVIVELVLG